MKGQRAPIEWPLRTEDSDRQHDEQRQEMNGIDFRQPIPEKPFEAGRADALPEHVRVVVRQDESAEHKKERHAKVARVEKHITTAECRHPRDEIWDMIQEDDERCIEPNSGQTRQFDLAHGLPKALPNSIVNRSSTRRRSTG